MAIDPQMLASMLMQQGQSGQPGQQVPHQGGASTAMQGGNDFLKMMMLRQMMQQKPQQPQQPQMPQQPQNPMIPPPQAPNPMMST
jgi:hypothetical protein